MALLHSLRGKASEMPPSTRAFGLGAWTNRSPPGRRAASGEDLLGGQGSDKWSL